MTGRRNGRRLFTDLKWDLEGEVPTGDRARQGVSASKGGGELGGKSCECFYAIIRNLVQAHWYWHVKTNFYYDLMNNQASMLQCFYINEVL